MAPRDYPVKNGAGQVIVSGENGGLEPDPTTVALDKANAALTLGKDIQSKLPAPPSAAPPAVSRDANKGDKEKTYALENHTHPARVQRTIVSLAANGQATWLFGKPFDAMPSLGYMVFQTAGGRVTVDAVEWQREVMTPAPNGKYVGVKVAGSRDRPMPTIAPLSSGLTLLTSLITALNTVFTALSGYVIVNPDKADLAGVQVHLTAGDQM